MALPVSRPAAREEPGVTDPSELFAAAHASAVAVILATILDRNQTPAHELIVMATYEYAGDWYDVRTIEFSVHGRIPNIDSRRFEEGAYAAIERYRRSFGVDARGAVSVRITLT
jgi:organic hydroperoxide reductase OsmC/OhrA